MRDDIQLALCSTLVALGVMVSQAAAADNLWYSAQPVANDPHLGTEAGIEGGLQVSDYRYQEHDAADVEFMHLTAVKYGVTLDATKNLANEFFLRGELRLAYSQNDYWSEPTGDISDDSEDWSGDLRALVGRDYLVAWGRSVGLSPYTGVGYRILYEEPNDVPGSYRRQSQYLYIPIGITSRIRLSASSRLSLNAEFDGLLNGVQKSFLSDVSSTRPDINNRQNKGVGWRGNLMYEFGSFSVGPFVEYWNIQSSELKHYLVGGAPAVGYEPHNQTIDYGLQLKYRL